MNSVKKMVLLPIEKYDRLLKYQQLHVENGRVSQESTHKFNQSQASTTDTGYHPILEQHITDSKLSNELILATIPKQFKTRARGLLDYIGQSDLLDWNEQGTLIARGRIVSHSHIADLVRHAMRDYTSFNPAGQREFYTILFELNVPTGLIGNTRGLHEFRERSSFQPPGELEEGSSGTSWISL